MRHQSLPTGCSVGTKQGFSIIRYQANSTGGSSIPHGLSQTPNFVIVKSLETTGSSNSDWTVFHSTLRGIQKVYLNQNNAAGSTGSWNDTNPDVHVITLGTAHVSNLSPNHYIIYVARYPWTTEIYVTSEMVNRWNFRRIRFPSISRNNESVLIQQKTGKSEILPVTLTTEQTLLFSHT